MVTAFQTWLYQIEHLTVQKYQTMSALDYCIVLVLCFTVGFMLLRSRH